MGERSEPELQIDERGVRLERSDGSSEAVTWSELEEVRVATTSAGPFAEDLFIVFVAEGGDHGVVVPLSLGGDDLIGRLQQLSGFDNEAFIRAMGSAEEGMVTCWRRAERPSEPD